eukprot:1514354-Prymnesium_polylepis.1
MGRRPELKSEDAILFGSTTQWLNEEKTQLKPTKDAKTFKEYKYVVEKPTLQDRIWRMEEHET